MDWKKFFRPILRQEPRPLVRDFDKKLVKSLRRRFWPSLRQLSYLGRFLGRGEKIAILACALVIAATSIVWGIVFVPKHLSSTPKIGGEYSEALIGQPKLINPIFAAANDVDADITPLLYARLFKIGANQKLIPELAAGYTVSEDGKIYTVKLREDAYWTDGEKINADDVAFTFEYIQNPETNSPLFTAFNGVIVEKTNDYEITFTLKDAFAPFTSNLSVGILPEHVFSMTTAANLRLAKENLQPAVTSGPWKFSKMTKNEEGVETYTLERNTRYFGEQTYLKKLSFKFYNDQASAADELKSRVVMGLAFLPRNLSEAYGGKNFNSYELHLPQYTAIFFNQSAKASLKNLEVRTALAKAIDKETIMNAALGDLGEVIDAPIPSNFIGYHPDIAKIAYNVDEAAALLDKNWTRLTPEEYFALKRDAMIKEKETDVKTQPDFATNSTTLLADLQKQAEDLVRSGMRPDQTYYRKNSKNEILSVNLTTVDTAEYETAAEAIALAWRAVGVQTNVVIIPSSQISREALKGRAYDVLLFSEILGDDPDLFPFWHSSQTEYPGLNLAMFSDKDADALIENARVASSTEARADYYKKFQDILAKDIPAIFLYSPTYEYLIDKKVQGVDVGRIYSPADRFNNINSWYTKTSWWLGKSF
ncbi:MAG: peptide ABC transporter substrate-binding protein [Patescibacteria group bacterium]